MTAARKSKKEPKNGAVSKKASKEKEFVRDTDIAIIGMACRLPGASDYSEFWNNLELGINSIQKIPSKRWNIDKYYSPDIKATNKTYSKWCGILENIDQFDNSFFNISPREAHSMDPQMRLLLEETWHCIEDSGVSLDRLREKITSVFLGVMTNDYLQMTSAPDVNIGSHTVFGSYVGFHANRISYMFGFQGPSITSDEACASSLVSIHQARISLLTGESDYAFTAGVNLNFHPLKQISFAKARMLSPDGQCKPFDKEANGYVPGDGIVVLLLQRIDDALKSGNSIYGVIKGSAVNHGGYALSFTAPRVEAQRDVILSAYKSAGLNPETITYVEAHGTGTSLGDPIEIEALTQAFSKYTKKKHFCKIGSVKSNIGHLEAAAGISSIIKVLLMMRHRKVPKTMNIKTLNPIINFEMSPFVVAEEISDWVPASNRLPLRAGVSSFGGGGLNSHIVLEEYKNQKETHDYAPVNNHLFLLSAKLSDSLKKIIDKWKSFVNTQQFSDYCLQDICRTLAVGRGVFDYRTGCLIKGKDDLRAFIKSGASSLLKKNVNPWCIRIGNFSFNNIEQIKPLLNQNILYKKNLDKIQNSLNSLKAPEKLWEGFLQKQWPESSQPLYSFMAGYAYINTLIDLGFNPNLVMCENEGVWLALVISGIVKLEDQLSFLIGREKLYNIKPTRPTIPFYDSIKKQTYMPYLFDEDYIRSFVNKISVKKEDFNYYINKARSIFENQHTFKHELKEWNIALKKSGKEIEDLLYDDRLLSKEEEGYKREKLFLLVSIMSSFCKLNKKWNLTEHKRIDDKGLYELLDLVVDEVMPKTVLIELFIGKNQDFEAMAEILNKRQIFMNMENSYEQIKKRNKKFPEISNISDWIKTVIEADNTPPFDGNSNYFNFGNCSELTIPCCYVNSNITEKFDNCFNDLLLQLWLHGVNIKWESLYEEGSFKKVSLPVYAFDRQSFWIEKLADYKQWVLPESVKKIADLTSIDEGALRPYKYQPCPTTRDTALKEAPQMMYYHRKWEKSGLDIKKISNARLRHILIFDTDEHMRNGLAKRLKSEEDGTRLILVKPGKGYKNLRNQTFEVNPDQKQDYVRLLKELKGQDLLPDRLLHNWFAGNGSNEFPVLSHQDFMENERKRRDFSKIFLSRGIYSIYYLLHACSEINAKQLTRIVVLYKGEKQMPNPFTEAISGYSRSLRLLLPKMAFSTVELLGDKNDVQEIVVEELKAQETDACGEIRYEKGDRYIGGVKQLDLENYRESILREQGVYLITGGCGALGLIFARYLAERYHANLVLLGRSELDSIRREKVDWLKGLGAEVLYQKCDVVNLEDVKGVIETIKGKFGRLNGVIHAAGGLDEKSILQKEITDFKQTLRPKIEGTQNLDVATREEPLDFFMLFSSTSAVLGDFGQCDYAIANRFLDSYMNLREILRAKKMRQGRTISINWPLWKEGGIHLNKEGESLYLQTSGMSYLETDWGLKAFEDILTSKHSQVVVISGEKTSVNRILGIESEEMLKKTRQVSPQKATKDVEQKKVLKTVPKPSIEKKLETDMKRIVSDILGTEPDKLDITKNVGDFGFDSITLTDFANILSENYQIEITPIVFFGYSSIQRLCGYMMEMFGDKVENYYAEKEKKEGIGKEACIVSSPEGEPCQTVPHVVEKCVEIKAVNQETEAVNQEREVVVIVGASGVFPGSNNLDRFWENLESEKDLITEIPLDRWNWRNFDDNKSIWNGKKPSKWGGFIEDADKFDPCFFSISPRDAKMMDPQHRIFLQTVWKTIEDGGYKASDLSGREVGVFVGVQFTDYQQLLSDLKESNPQILTGNSHAALVNRISYFFNFHGPSEAIDTACSSSLVAIHRAVRSIQNGESELAIAGGVSLILSPYTMANVSQLGVLSPDGRCKTFDKKANGYVRGEGVGALLLKPLRKAIEDRNYIYAVIKGTVENHGGRANTLTAPNHKAQSDLLVKAYEEAGIDPCNVAFIETHGTGTELGDPVEIEGLKSAFNKLLKKRENANSRHHYCGLGTVKTNIGHLEPAAGIAGIMKVILSIQHKKLPGNLHFQEINPYIDLNKTPFYVVDKTKPWERLKDEKGREIPLIAGVSSFGFGGVNTHVILEEFENKAHQYDESKKAFQLIILSAKNRERLNDYARNMVAFFEKRIKQVESDKQDLIMEVKNDLLQMISEILRVNKEEIDAEEEVTEYGLDTIGISYFINRIKEKYKIEIPPTLFSEHRSIEAVAHYLNSKHNDTLGVYYHKHSNDITKKGDFNIGISLSDVAYTLQVGREPMEERLALVVSSIKEMCEKLSHYCDGKEEIEDLYLGNIKKNKFKYDFLKGVEGDRFVKSIIDNKKVSVIGQLWVSGVEMDWNLLYSDPMPKLLPLPSYPFQKKRYWFDNHQNNSTFIDYKADSQQKSLDINNSFLNKEEGLKSMNKYNMAPYHGNEVALKLINENIAIIKIQNKKNKNMLSDDTIHGLIAKFAEIQDMKKIKAVILTGYDNLFCMGGTQEQLNDISDMKRKCSGGLFNFIYRGLLECKVPVISAMQGHAMGGGLVFGLFANIIVMSTEGVYSANFTKYGFTPGVGSTYILQQKLGLNLAMEMMFTAKSYQGEELKNRGAPFIFCKKDQVLPEAIKLATMLAKKPLATLMTLKQELTRRELVQLTPIIETEVRMHDSLFSQIDVKNLIDSYFNHPDKPDITTQKHEKQENDRNTDNKIILKSKNKDRIHLKEETDEKKERQVKLPKLAFGEYGEDRSHNIFEDEENVLNRIIEIVTNILHLPGDQIDVESAFKDLGVDSISSVEIIRDANKSFCLDLDAVELYNYSTVAHLTQFIFQNIKSNKQSGKLLNDDYAGQILTKSEGNIKENKAIDLLNRLREGSLDVDNADNFIEQFI